MAAGTHRTDTAYFVALLIMLAAGLAWAGAHHRAGSSSSTNSQSTSSSATVTTQSAPAVHWSGELILLNDRGLIGRTDAGVERTIYAPTPGTTISAVTNLAGDHLLVALADDEATVVEVNARTGAQTPRPDLHAVALTALRPTTEGLAQVSFSNAERNFGSTVTLKEAGSAHVLYQATGVTVTALAWRADGDALALGTQTSVIIVPLSAGDAQTISLTSPVRSLTWHGGNVLAVTEKDGGVELNLAGNPRVVPQTDGFGDVGRDLVEYAPDRFIWLRSATGSSAVVATTDDPVRYRSKDAQPIELTRATRILGVLAK